MEIFEVFFRGKEVKAVKDSAGKIYIRLPHWKAKSGKRIDEIISRESNGWKYEVISDFDFDNSSELWIRNDGRIAWNTKGDGKIVVSKQHFNPDSPKAGKLNAIVTELYRTVEQLKVYEKRNIPASTMIDLRRKKMLLALKLLGYSSINDVRIELEESKICFALGRIREQLDNYVSLGAYVHLEGREKGEEIIKLNIPEEMTGEEFAEMAKPVEDEYLADVEFSEGQEDKKARKREICRGYCEITSRKMPQSDWLLYTRILKETAQLLLELNADLLESSAPMEISDLSQLADKEVKDRISRLIESKDFTKACEIEKRFLVREAKKFIDEVEYILRENGEESRNSYGYQSIKDLVQEETEFIEMATGVVTKTETGFGIDD